MPDKQRVYGTPIGATGGKPINTGRTKPTPGSAKSYLDHMIEAHRAFEAQKARSNAQPVRGNSGGLSNVLASGRPPVGIGGRQREAAIMGNVDKMSR